MTNRSRNEMLKPARFPTFGIRIIRISKLPALLESFAKRLRFLEPRNTRNTRNSERTFFSSAYSAYSAVTPVWSWISNSAFRLFLSAAGIFCLCVTLTGCISKSKADAQARAAFVAGEQQAMRNMEQVKARGPSVTVIGQVRNPRVPWTDELTLAKALHAAEYFGDKDPTEILIVRSGKAIRCDPRKLLAGEDMPLEPQDLIQLK